MIIFSSQSMKKVDSIVLDFKWNTSQYHTFSFERAIYPEEYHGLPVLTYHIDEPGIDSLEVVFVKKREISPLNEQKLSESLSKDAQLFSMKKLLDRGGEHTVVTILPFQYDSITSTFYQIDLMEITLKKSVKSSSKSALRVGQNGSSSVLSSGEWYKIPVIENGVYKLDYNYLNQTGVDVAAIDPKKIKIFGNGGGMLPQKNSDSRPVDLAENAISVFGESDGRYDQGDYILFYGQGPDHKRLNSEGILEYEKNFFSDTSFYFLTIASDDGLRIAKLENLGVDQPKIQHYDDYLIYEKDEHNIINSGRAWYGEKFDFTLTYKFKFEFPGLVPDTDLTLTSAIMGQTYEEASLDIFINDVNVGQQPVYTIADGFYLAKGLDQKNTFVINTNSVPISENLTIGMSYNPVGSKLSKASLNYFTVQCTRHLKMYESQTVFRSLESTQYAMSTFGLENGASIQQIWDITNPLEPKNQQFSIDGENAIFGAFSDELKEYIAFDDGQYLIPEKASKINNQDLHGSSNVDFLIITHPRFFDQAQQLAELRENHDGLKVQVVTTEQVYNEFSSGKQDVTAIRDFIKYMYEKGSDEQKLQNVLLFGKGSYDYKDRVDRNTNFVPIYSSRNSLHPINSYSSDDYYGFLDDDEGEWVESYSGDLMMDVGIGRLPVKTEEEAKIMVDKLESYATNPTSFGPWRNEVFFIADDGDGNLHQRDADRLAVLVDSSYTTFNVNKIYIDAYPQVQTSIGETAPEAKAELIRSIEKGGLIFNFTGHGSTTRWTSETILNITTASELENEQALPLFVTATCEFGRHDNPKAISGAEYLLVNPQGGAIGLLTTARPVYSSTNFILNEAFYHNVFTKEENRYLTIGEIFRRTKNQSLKGSVNRNFSLLADPSMTLAYARDEIVLYADQEEDTLSALNTIQLQGQVLDINGVINTSFNGTLTTKVYDRPSEITTYGHEDSPMTFSVRDNLLFNGEVTVSEGEFDVEFIVPKNVSFDFANGKISMYAVDGQQKLDAGGSNIEFIVGGQSEDFPPDNTPPEIELYINDSSFVSNGITGPDIQLVAQIFDESGINISKSNDGQELAASLDDGEEFSVRNHYVADLDTYKSGWVTYPLKDLSIGTHKIRLTAWDVYNNPGEAEIEFFVVDDVDLTVEKLINYPNPFSDFTTFSFETNRAGDDLEITIDVLSMQGKLVKQFVYTKENSESRISDIVWDGKNQNGSNILGGVYIFRVSVRSLNDGSKNQANEKLIIIN